MVKFYCVWIIWYSINSKGNRQIIPPTDSATMMKTSSNQSVRTPVLVTIQASMIAIPWTTVWVAFDKILINIVYVILLNQEPRPRKRPSLPPRGRPTAPPRRGGMTSQGPLLSLGSQRGCTGTWSLLPLNTQVLHSVYLSDHSALCLMVD